MYNELISGIYHKVYHTQRYKRYFEHDEETVTIFSYFTRNRPDEVVGAYIGLSLQEYSDSYIKSNNKYAKDYPYLLMYAPMNNVLDKNVHKYFYKNFFGDLAYYSPSIYKFKDYGLHQSVTYKDFYRIYAVAETYAKDYFKLHDYLFERIFDELDIKEIFNVQAVYNKKSKFLSDTLK